MERMESTAPQKPVIRAEFLEGINSGEEIVSGWELASSCEVSETGAAGGWYFVNLCLSLRALFLKDLCETGAESLSLTSASAWRVPGDNPLIPVAVLVPFSESLSGFSKAVGENPVGILSKDRLAADGERPAEKIDESNLRKIENIDLRVNLSSK